MADNPYDAWIELRHEFEERQLAYWDEGEEDADEAEPE